MDPGILIPNIGHFEEVSVQAACLEGFHEHGFVGFGTTRSHDHPVQIVLYNSFLDDILGILGAGKQVIIRKNNIW